MKKENAMIVLCGGLGKRMGKAVPKMLLPLGRKPLIYWTLQNLQTCLSVHAIVLAVPKEWRAQFENIVIRGNFSKVICVVEGGQERVDSTRNAFAALDKNFKWIGIHDGARPFVSHSAVTQCYEAARKTGGAIVAVPSKDTIKLVDQRGTIQTSPDRAQCYLAQTPQIFSRAITEKMHGAKAASHAQRTRFCTDDASIAQVLGYRVQVVSGSYDNIKVTTPEDLVLARDLIQNIRGKK